MPEPLSPAVSSAEKILAGTAVTDPHDYRTLAKSLEKENELSLARRLVECGRADPNVFSNEVLLGDLTTYQAVLTYKDSELPPARALDAALHILAGLRGAYTVASTFNQEVLGIAAAIWKRRFELTAQKRDLERSAGYYLRASAQGVGPDQGYTAINAAFVLDELAGIEEADAGEVGSLPPDSVTERRRQARTLRETILAELTAPIAPPEGPDREDDYWVLATIAEAQFGLGHFPEATKLLARAAAIPGPDWYKETTARQLAKLALLIAAPSAGGIDPAARETLMAITGGNAAAVEDTVAGKIGLALSGGGFRASLFHIGVLAQLAECDLLRRVECLSCVSGGSIIGAHYYLELRKLLLTKTDAEVTRDDYIAIVRKLEEDFLKGVQRNIRTRVAADWLTNVKMMFLPNYSRTRRVGELYETELFAKVADGLGTQSRWLEDLAFSPAGIQAGRFNPKTDNWRRQAKVPILVLNATALNTGHNWQFTATWMGEPPANIDSEIDANERLRRLYHRQMPSSARPTRIRLGQAVAASSCVPGLFEPLPLEKLYPEGRVVRLVDGGVHDNQGTAALLDQGCSVLIVSDASGQMETDRNPSDGLLAVPLRSNSILQARVRDAHYRELDARRGAGLLRGLVFLHLKRELPSVLVDWLESQDPSTPARVSPMTSYGVQRHVQRRLAAIRTDLDSFSDTEAYALMLSGYRMAGQALRAGELGLTLPHPPGTGAALGWRFAIASAGLEDGSLNSPMIRQLQVAHQIAFKVWRLSRGLQLGAAGLAAVCLLLLGLYWASWSGVALWKEATLSLGEVVLALFAVTVVLAGLPALRRFSLGKSLQQVAIGLGMVTLGFWGALLHLHVFDRLFLYQGRFRGK